MSEDIDIKSGVQRSTPLFNVYTEAIFQDAITALSDGISAANK